MRTIAYNVQTTASTIMTTPPNYTFRMDDMYINTYGTTNSAVDTLTLYATGVGTINGYTPGSVFIGKYTVVSGIPTVIKGYEVTKVPAGSALIGISASGNITVTITGEYQYSRD